MRQVKQRSVVFQINDSVGQGFFPIVDICAQRKLLGGR